MSSKKEMIKERRKVRVEGQSRDKDMGVEDAKIMT